MNKIKFLTDQDELQKIMLQKLKQIENSKSVSRRTK